MVRVVPHRLYRPGLAASALLSLALLADGSLRAEEPRSEGPAMTALAAGELGRSTHVALATLTRVRDVRGLMIAHMSVERWLRGRGAPGEITVLVGGPRPSTDPRAPSLPFLDRRPGMTYLLFLAQRPEGEAFELQNRLTIEGLEGIERVRAVEAQVELASIVDPDQRARAVLRALLGALEAHGAWTRANAARELNYLAGVRPDVFDEQARARVARAAENANSPSLRSWLGILNRRLDALPAAPPLRPGAGLAPPPVPSPFPAPVASLPVLGPVAGLPANEEALARLDALLVKAGPAAVMQADRLLRRLEHAEQRVWIVDWLAASGDAAALPVLRAQYGREDEVSVREAVVRATGYLGSEADVPWLVERLANARLVEAALVALARIRTPSARSALEQHRRACLGGDEAAQDLAARIEQLLSPAFEELDRAAGTRGAPAPDAPRR